MADNDPRPTATSADLEWVRRPLADLRAAIDALEEASAAPAASRTAEWSMAVHEALVDLGAAFERHIAATEGPDGLHDRIRDAAPRLSIHVDRMAAEHRATRQAITEAVDAAREGSRSADPELPEQVRERVNDLVRRLLELRGHGADLIYEAYEVDIGAGD